MVHPSHYLGHYPHIHVFAQFVNFPDFLKLGQVTAEI